MSFDLLLLAFHAAPTLLMVGVIWFVQVVHYPLFGEVGISHFARYEELHQARTTRIVAPLMFAELGSALLLVVLRPSQLSLVAPLTGLVLIAGLWASTFFWQVPLHRRLSKSFDHATHRQLVSSNWLRTILWSLRGCLALWMMVVA